MLRLILALLTLTACSTVWADPEADAAKPPKVDLQKPIDGAQLRVERVQLAAPQAFRGADATVTEVAEVVELRVEAPTAIQVRAVDPVLHVGGVEITEYRYEDAGKVLVFITTELPAPAQDAEIYLQFGDQLTTRTPLPAFRPEDVEDVSR